MERQGVRHVLTVDCVWFVAWILCTAMPVASKNDSKPDAVDKWIDPLLPGEFSTKTREPWTHPSTKASPCPTMATDAVTTEHPDVMPDNRKVSTEDILQCVLSARNLNLTAEGEIIIKYVRHPQASKSSAMSATDDRTRMNVTKSGEKPAWPLPQLSSMNFSTGRCSLSVNAPPGHILSILFLNQTCSRHNTVVVDDVYDTDASTTFTGCNPWISPGYDFTTTNKTAEIVIELTDPSEFYRLEMQIVVLAKPSTRQLVTRYVSFALGYIQSPYWNPYVKSSFHDVKYGTASILVPSNHVTMTSVIYLYGDNICGPLRACSYHLTLLKVVCGLAAVVVWTSKPKLLSLDPFLPPKVVLPITVTEFQVQYGISPAFFFVGFRVLFSFHQPTRAPQQTHGGLWNCSVPFWLDFRYHLMCNSKTQCVGREDEMWCPLSTCQQGGVLIDDRCYIFLPLKARTSWLEARTACKRHNASLAIFPTWDSWFHLSLLMQALPKRREVFFGLRCTDANSPHMYRHLARWEEGSIDFYPYHFICHMRPGCGHVYSDSYEIILDTRGCGNTISPSTYALCQMSSANDMKKIRKGNGDDGGGNLYIGFKNAKSTTEIRNSVVYPVPSISCPHLHRAHDFFAHDSDSACCVNYDLSSGAGNTFTDKCAGVDAVSFEALFTCNAGGKLVSYSVVCDHVQDCTDNSDESFCVFEDCSAVTLYQCSNGQCIPLAQHCDDIVQCIDESDEADCSPHRQGTRIRKSHNMRPPFPPYQVNFDGRGDVIYSPLTTGSETGVTVCPETHFMCSGGQYCLPAYVRCNGVHDCADLDDELGCNSYTCPGFYRCRGLMSICLHPDHLCDGWPQCPQHDDERFCNLTCPVQCACLGHAFTCTSDFEVEVFPRLRYLAAGGSGLKLDRLGNNVMLIYLNLALSGLSHMGNLSLPNLLSIDLSQNQLRAIDASDLSRLKNLQNLTLARNPLSELFLGNISSHFHINKVHHIDLHGVKLQQLDVRSSLPFPKLISLNLSNSGVTRLIGDGFRSTTALGILDIRGCPMTVFPKGIFDGLKDLHQVFADSYKLCCAVNLPDGFHMDNCQAPFNELSSCDALLRFDAFRVCLSVLAALAASGNLGCFCLRIFALASRGKTGFNVFVTHLCMSDFLMSVYLVIVGVADRLYLGRYLWEDARWRHSASCKVAGILALLSCEVSALIICLITLDRFLVIRFPFSRVGFSPLSAQITSGMVWVSGFVLTTVPLLPFTSHWQFYGQTGICIPLPITRNDFPGHHYSFGIMILLNLVIFLIIAVGQITVYLSMTSNAMSFIDSTRKSRDLIVARRLIAVVVSDFLCWFPLGLLGVLAAMGVPVPGEVNVGMAIFVLPLNSALNPFLYTFNMILEKKRRSTEEKLLTLVMEQGFRKDKDETGVKE